LSPPLLVTRPAREAARWVEALRVRGIDAHALPLIAIGPAPDAPALARARARIAGMRAVMFVSANAVEGLLEGPGAGPWPAATRAWATGPGTRAALDARGVPAGCVDAPPDDAGQFDSEALWVQVSGQVRPGDRVLVVRGGNARGEAEGRDWLAARLSAAGAQVETVVAYVRRLPAWGEEQRRLAGLPGAWWLFSSSEALANLGAVAPGFGFAGARAICTHPRIAAAAQRAGFGRIETLRPQVEAVAAFLQSCP
jgi:uroporphyrinogen-III synthase